jgi:HrpA-like RNA helicase
VVRTPFHASVHANPRMPELPINDVLPDLKAVLPEQPEAVLQAPTGAGKATHVPLPLLDADRLDFGEDQPKYSISSPATSTYVDTSSSGDPPL